VPVVTLEETAIDGVFYAGQLLDSVSIRRDDAGGIENCLAVRHPDGAGLASFVRDDHKACPEGSGQACFISRQ
jgi:hypothetical protein